MHEFYTIYSLFGELLITEHKLYILDYNGKYGSIDFYLSVLDLNSLEKTDLGTYNLKTTDYLPDVYSQSIQVQDMHKSEGILEIPVKLYLKSSETEIQHNFLPIIKYDLNKNTLSIDNSMNILKCEDNGEPIDPLNTCYTEYDSESREQIKYVRSRDSQNRYIEVTLDGNSLRVDPQEEFGISYANTGPEFAIKDDKVFMGLHQESATPDGKKSEVAGILFDFETNNSDLLFKKEYSANAFPYDTVIDRSAQKYLVFLMDTTLNIAGVFDLFEETIFSEADFLIIDPWSLCVVLIIPYFHRKKIPRSIN